MFDYAIDISNCRKVTVVDYQGVCLPQESYLSSAPRAISGSIIKVFGSLLGFFWSTVLTLGVHELWSPVGAWAENLDDTGENVTSVRRVQDSTSRRHQDSTSRASSDDQFFLRRRSQLQRRERESLRAVLSRVHRGSYTRNKRVPGRCTGSSLASGDARDLDAVSSPQAALLREKDGSLHPPAREAQHERSEQSTEGKIDELSCDSMREVTIEGLFALQTNPSDSTLSNKSVATQRELTVSLNRLPISANTIR